VVLENGAMVLGQAGIRDHTTIGAAARVAPRAGVTRNIPAGVTVSGYPAQLHHEELRYEAALRRVPKLLETIKSLERRITELEREKPAE